MLSIVIDFIGFRDLETGDAYSVRELGLTPIGMTQQGPVFAIPKDSIPAARLGLRGPSSSKGHEGPRSFAGLTLRRPNSTTVTLSESTSTAKDQNPSSLLAAEPIPVIPSSHPTCSSSRAICYCHEWLAPHAVLLSPRVGHRACPATLFWC